MAAGVGVEGSGEEAARECGRNKLLLRTADHPAENLKNDLFKAGMRGAPS